MDCHPGMVTDASSFDVDTDSTDAHEGFGRSDEPFRVRFPGKHFSTFCIPSGVQQIVESDQIISKMISPEALNR